MKPNSLWPLFNRTIHSTGQTLLLVSDLIFSLTPEALEPASGSQVIRFGYHCKQNLKNLKCIQLFYQDKKM